MYRIDSVDSVAVMPSPPAAGVGGYYRDGDLDTGTPGTVASADHMNAIQEELIAVILFANLVLDKADRSQLLKAIQAILQLRVDQLAAVARTGRYADLIDPPKLAPVALSGDYNDLKNPPAIPQPITPTWNNLADRPNLTPTGYQYVGQYAGSFSEANATGRTVIYHVKGGSAGGNRFQLSGAINGAEIVSCSDSNPEWSKSGALTLVCPPGSTVTCTSSPYAEGAGVFTVYRFVGPLF